jgi:hypothetical protein
MQYPGARVSHLPGRISCVMYAMRRRGKTRLRSWSQRWFAQHVQTKNKEREDRVRRELVMQLYQSSVILSSHKRLNYRKMMLMTTDRSKALSTSIILHLRDLTLITPLSLLLPLIVLPWRLICRSILLYHKVKLLVVYHKSNQDSLLSLMLSNW